MEVVLLGSGAADGWPNPFCDCGSCGDARTSGTSRGQTAALVDDRLLLDCGPEVAGAAGRAGRSLAGLRYVLITHAHPDHLGPQLLLWRSWIDDLDELCVVGPATALEACRDWTGPDDAVRFIPVAAGERIRLGPYDVRVLPAQHRVLVDGDAVLYDVTDAHGERLLWATDTGPWPRDRFAAVAHARYDAVFLEETFGDRDGLSAGHLGFAGFGDMIATMREVEAVTDRTDVVAVHLGHHNPPNAELSRRLEMVGARPGRDGEVVVLGGAATRPHRVFVTGGARSGKSCHAEAMLADVVDVVYIAAGGPRDDDPDWARRVAAHRARRPSTWTTLETTDLAATLRATTAPVLIDCLGTWLAARCDHHGVWTGGDLAGVRAEAADLVAAWRTRAAATVAVSNEVGSGVVPGTPAGRLFRDELGRLNAAVAAASDRVVLMVAGCPLSVR
ncbi:bifunctional adenosylcobinamide kinase/adenosylcobinamide-phosphate guanylyltransferase [Gordonia humi]|uniref:Adenosylcobinamide kinase n=1 Tax=Gordonia humi TaxID=686429 RepID=A0A840EX03_9ACTN|nr:bifunctional adenosylcobinamide kinase/adenosylcobinamide-phosphate guanylyltransferase [Gordonia humi]MBB4134844.1 adenosylcobinamide kinase/adenosylcobinamide-phosphate guanylyltransferase [Gordonia humi]